MHSKTFKTMGDAVLFYKDSLDNFHESKLKSIAKESPNGRSNKNWKQPPRQAPTRKT